MTNRENVKAYGNEELVMELNRCNMLYAHSIDANVNGSADDLCERVRGYRNDAMTEVLSRLGQSGSRLA